MQEDFHYYATYCAAFLAGYTHEESLAICYSAQFVDCCSRTFLKKIGGPSSAATTQLQMELLDAKTDLLGLQDITRIWASFHFLPYDLNATLPSRGKKYLNKYRLICNSNGSLVKDTVELARNSSLPAVGLAMHVLADTWAHKYFAGTPSLVINNTDWHFFELFTKDDSEVIERIHFNHNPASPDVQSKHFYTNSVYYGSENSIMNLGHGRAGHLPDYSFIKYKYLPAWGQYQEIVKDNPSDYMHAFSQMVYAMKYLRSSSTEASFELDTYAWEDLDPYQEQITSIITQKQLLASDDWKAFGEKLSGQTIPDFDIDSYCQEYISAPKSDKDKTFLGEFISAAINQKSMVTNRILASGNILSGFNFDIKKFKKLGGI